MGKHHKCLVCEGEQLQPLKGYYEQHQMVKCQDCSFVFMERIPTLEELDAHYSVYAYSGEGYLSPITIKSYNLLLDEFEKYRKTNKILDVGCGRGWFLDAAKKRGWEVYGTEFSSTAVQLNTEKGIAMKEGKLNPADFENVEFDVITSFEVIEHINNPNEELENIASLLRKGGLFFCTTPNFDSLLRYYLKAAYNVIGYPEHLSYYTKKTLNKVVKKHGLKPIKFQSTGISITRFKTSKKTSTKKFVEETASDEILRKKIDQKWYLGVAKNIVNKLLTWTNTGMTLKGYYIKN